MRKGNNEERIRSIRRKEKKFKTLSKQEQVRLTNEILREKWGLVYANIGLVYDVLKVYKSQDPAFGFEDLLQHGKIALYDLIGRYNPNRKVNGKKAKFGTYARNCLRGEILKLLERKTYNNIPIDTIGKLQDGTEFEPSADTFSPFGPAHIFEQEKQGIVDWTITELISILPAKQKIIVEGYLKEIKGKEIADTLKNTPEAVSQIFKRAKINMRKQVTGDLWDMYRNTIKYRDKLFKLFGTKDIEQEKRIKTAFKESKHRGREEYNRWLDGMSEKKRDAYFEIRLLNTLIDSYIKEIRKKIRDSWEDTGIQG